MSRTRRKGSTTHRRPRRLGALLAGLSSAATIAACGSTAAAPNVRAAADSERPATSLAQIAHTRQRPARVILRTVASRYGRVLVDYRGHALYLFTHDTGPTSTCSGACARAWPPYLVAGRGAG